MPVFCFSDPAHGMHKIHYSNSSEFFYRKYDIQFISVEYILNVACTLK